MMGRVLLIAAGLVAAGVGLVFAALAAGARAYDRHDRFEVVYLPDDHRDRWA